MMDTLSIVNDAGWVVMKKKRKQQTFNLASNTGQVTFFEVSLVFHLNSISMLIFHQGFTLEGGGCLSLLHATLSAFTTFPWRRDRHSWKRRETAVWLANLGFQKQQSQPEKRTLALLKIQKKMPKWLLCVSGDFC